MIIDELLISLGFKLDKKSVKDLQSFQDGFKKAATNLIKMTAAATAGSAALVAFTKVMSESTDELAKSARRIGVEAQELDALRFAMNLVTGSGAGVNGMLEAFGKNLSQLSRGEGPILAFNKLGVVLDGTETQLDDITGLLKTAVEGASKLGKIERLEFLEAAGLGGFALAADDFEGFLSALQRAEDLSFISKEDTDRAEKFNDEWAALFRIVREFSVLISSSLSPFLTEVLEHFQDWMKVNKELLRQDLVEVFTTLGEAFKIAANFMGRLASGALELVKHVGGLNTVLKVTAGVFALLAAAQFGLMIKNLIGLVTTLAVRFGVLNFQALLVPGSILLLIALIIALKDEFDVFARGGDTFFTKLHEKFPKFSDFVSDVIAAIILNFEKLFAIIEDPLNFDNWKKYFTFISDGLKKLGLGGYSPSAMKGASGTGKIPLTFMEIARGATVAPLSGGGGGGGSTTPTQKIEVTINGDATGLDKTELKNAIVKQVDDSNRQAMRNLETGLNR